METEKTQPKKIDMSLVSQIMQRIENRMKTEPTCVWNTYCHGDLDDIRAYVCMMEEIKLEEKLKEAP